MLTCENCGTSFERKARGRIPRFCSKKCSDLYYYNNRNEIFKFEFTCEYCDAKFETNNEKQRFCSINCRGASQQTLKKIIKVCPQCKQEFRPNYKNQVYCCNSCVGLSQRKQYVCKNCGITFNLTSGGKGIFCSRDCSFEYMHNNRKLPKPKPLLICKICGREFTGRSDSKVCSRECELEKKRIRAKECFTSVKETNEYTEKRCIECGSTYRTNFYAESKRFCSEKCSQLYYGREYKIKRKEQISRAYVEPVRFNKVYKRDNGLCQICGEFVEYDKTPTNPMGATIDHVIPLSKGGLHSMSNCQLAHRLCNSIKGDRIDYKYNKLLI